MVEKYQVLCVSSILLNKNVKIHIYISEKYKQKSKVEMLHLLSLFHPVQDEKFCLNNLNNDKSHRIVRVIVRNSV